MCNSMIRHRLMGMAIAPLLIPAMLTLPSLASPNLSQIDAALNHPTAAERFFNEGQQQFEQEIQQLSEPTNLTEPLQIDEGLSDTSEQQRLQLEQLEPPDGRSQDRNIPSPSNAF